MSAPSTPSPPAASANKAWLRALELTSGIERAPRRLLYDVVEEQAAARPEDAALVSDDTSLNYGALAARMHRYARWALAQGMAKGETVALMAGNTPDYMAAWLGLTGVGIVVALINANLRGEALAHSLAAAAPRAVIASGELAAVAEAAISRSADAAALWVLGESEGRGLDQALASLPAGPLAAEERRGVSLRDTALLIYTSGTTGLPKAARVSHRRVMSWSLWFAGMLGAGPQDRLYDCLPMYHSVGGVVATGALLVSGGSVVIAPRFSASRFWEDVVRWECTQFQYIGELCRYLVKAAPSPYERQHRLRMVCGNGLREDVWTPFQARFQIPRILEFYAATEGNFSLFNAEGRPGAIGRVPGFMAHRFPVAIVAFDPDIGAPVRGADGRCVRCTPGEPGEAIGQISAADGSAAQRFEGYTDPEATEKKVLRDVFAPGDAWLRTGDLMRRDEKGFFYFVDRVGDTFRWKGENVAASEVSAAIEACPGVEASVVYGVTVPGADGRAGMAAIVAGEDFDLTRLRRRLVEALPDYARPRFLRLSAALAVTDTFKQKLGQLVAQGFDPEQIDDALYFDSPETGAFEPLDKALHARIAAGDVRL